MYLILSMHFNPLSPIEIMYLSLSMYFNPLSLIEIGPKTRIH